MIRLEKATTNDAERLLYLQRRAFQEDIKRYGWSPAIETLESLTKKMEDNGLTYHRILIRETVAGGICVIDMGLKQRCIGRLFIEPSFQNQGLGGKVLSLIEKEYPEVKKWCLNTPKDNRRNRHFYEKHGYVQVGEQTCNEYLTVIEYEKKIKRNLFQVLALWWRRK